MTTRLRVPATSLLATVLAAVALTGAAYAYWSTTGTGSASATTATLNPATNVSVPATSTGTVAVSWTAPTSPGSGGTLRYYVQRSSGSSTAAACGTSASATTASTSCTDTGVTNGTYTYTVTTVFNSWTTSSAASGAVSVNTVTAPTVTLSAPAGGSVTSATRPVFTGTTTDTSTITVAVHAGSTATGTLAASYTGTPTGTASPYAFSITATAALPDGTYTARASQTNSGGAGASSANTFLVDSTAPAPTINTVGTNNFTNSTTPTISGTAGRQVADSSHSADAGTVSVTIYNGTATSGGNNRAQSPLTATVNSSTGVWSVTPAALIPNATYTAVVQQTDAAGNTGTSNRTFLVDTAPPTVSKPTVNGRS